MSYAVLFSGQGTQHPGMLPWLEAEPASQAALSAMVAQLGADWREALEHANSRSNNAYAQPLIVGTALAAWAALAAQLPQPPRAIAGYSVGELAAYAAAHVLPVQTALDLSVQRAALMDAAVAGADTGLLSVSGLRKEQVLQVAQAWPARNGLSCVIDLGTEQGIYAGTSALLDACTQVLAERGAVCKRLEVRVASHSPWMGSAANGFAALLEKIPFDAPQATLVLNATGMGTRDPHLLRRALSTQIAHTVQWAGCMDTLAEQGVDRVIEIGAGATLSKLWNQRHPAIPSRALSEFRDAAGAAQWLLRD